MTLLLAGLLVSLPAAAQVAEEPLPIYTGSMDVMESAPEWTEGTAKYFNFQPGGQSGSVVVVKKADGAHLWDNAKGEFVLDQFTSNETPDKISFLRNDLLYYHFKENGHYLISVAPDLSEVNSAMGAEELKMIKTEGMQEVMAVKEFGKWGILDPRDHSDFLVGPRHDSISEATSWLKKRMSGLKGADETDLQCLIRLMGTFSSTYVTTENICYDGKWGVTAFTLRETPYAGPYLVSDYVEVSEGIPSNIPLHSVVFTVKDGVFKLAYSEETLETGYYGEGPMLPLSKTLLNVIKRKPIYARDGSVLFVDNYNYGYLIYPDGSFYSGYFQTRGSASNPDYIYVGGPYMNMPFYELFCEYCFSHNSKGEPSPSFKEFAEELRQRNLSYADDTFWTVGDYDKGSQTVQITFPGTDINPVDLPLPMRNWNEFYSLATTYGRSEWKVTVKIDPNPSTLLYDVTYLDISFPQRENMHFTYNAQSR